MRLWKSILELAWNFWMKLFFFSLGDGESKFLVSSAILWLYWVKVNFHWEGLSGQSRLSGQNKINENDNYLELNSSRTVRACTWFLLDTVAYLFYILNKSLCQELSHLSSTILHECWSASVPLKFPGNGLCVSRAVTLAGTWTFRFRSMNVGWACTRNSSFKWVS